jgi:hypothetical protein
MEILDKKVWLCVTRESNGIHTGYFSSVFEEIKAYVAAFIQCPAAQVYYWLKDKGCIGKDVNCLIRKCFTVEQQQKAIKSKYIKEKGVAVLKDSDEDDITCLLAYLPKNNVNKWPNPDTMNWQYPSEKPR